jgi:uracil-DNA glycosylase
MKYHGSCHCGGIAFDVEGELSQAMACNCSICARKGALMWFVPDLRHPPVRRGHRPPGPAHGGRQRALPGRRGPRGAADHALRRAVGLNTAAGSLDQLVARARACTLCADHLPLGPRPLLQAGTGARILIAGQAPGRRAHASGIPFDDASGDRLRGWLGLERAQFYDASRIAIIPMGLCYPGTGAHGDLPPRPECAPAWRAPLLERLPHTELTLVLGRHALAWHLPQHARATLSELLQAWRAQPTPVIPLPHPSPRNQAWMKRHPWFAEQVLPLLRQRVAQALAHG